MNEPKKTGSTSIKLTNSASLAELHDAGNALLFASAARRKRVREKKRLMRTSNMTT
jgi:hypothetical protein